MKNVLNRGFTLIELIIVIAVIAILAVGVIAALNPVEQSNRAKDGRAKNTMSELMGAIQRYYTSISYMPFCTATTGSCAQPNPTFAHQAVDSAGVNILTKLFNNNEITANFTQATTSDLQNIQETFVQATTAVSLCYRPISNAGQLDPAANKTSVGVVNGTCPSTAAGANCYFCVTQ